MGKKFKFDRTSNNHNSHLTNDDFCLTEQDFYPPSDNRVWKSKIYDIRGGDNFADECEYIFDLLEKEGYFEN